MTYDADTSQDFDPCRACQEPLWTTKCPECGGRGVTYDAAHDKSSCTYCMGGGRVCQSCLSGKY